MNNTKPRDPQPARDVLRERAARLAQPAPSAASDGVAALDFAVGGQRCLLELSWICEVLPLRAWLPVPLAQPPLLGLAQLRGRLLPVLDLAGLLAAAGGESPAPRQLLVLGAPAPVLALAVSEVHGLATLAALDAQRRGEPLDQLRPEIVRGVSAEGHLVLAGERLLALRPAAAPSLSPT